MIMVELVPGFKWRPLPPGRNHSYQDWASTGSDGLILHVAVGGDVSLHGWFSNAAARASSTWWAGKSGGREQYLDPFTHRGWTQGAGNSRYHAVETSGNPDEPLSDAQIDAVAAIYLQGHEWFDWPYRLANRPGERGLGWHGMGGSAWGGHPDCPGELRKAQRAEILRRAAAGGTSQQEDDMDLSDTGGTSKITGDFTVGQGLARGVNAYESMPEIRRQLAALRDELDKLTAPIPSRSGPVDPVTARRRGVSGYEQTADLWASLRDLSGRLAAVETAPSEDVRQAIADAGAALQRAADQLQQEVD